MLTFFFFVAKSARQNDTVSKKAKGTAASFQNGVVSAQNRKNTKSRLYYDTVLEATQFLNQQLKTPRTRVRLLSSLVSHGFSCF